MRDENGEIILQPHQKRLFYFGSQVGIRDEGVNASYHGVMDGEEVWINNDGQSVRLD